MSRIEMMVYAIVKKFFPNIAVTRRETIETLKSVYKDNKELKERTEYWRGRCFSAEQCAVESMRILRDRIDKHDEENQTALRYR